MCSKTNPCTLSLTNSGRRFITDGGIFALVFLFLLYLPIGDIAVSWKWIYMWCITIVILLQVVEKSPEEKYKVV